MKSSWARTAVVYQIYPLSFKDSNGDGRGDLDGITSKLDYLQELGIGAIWLSPIYSSPMADFGYDISDYQNIHPWFGKLENFDFLIQSAHERGIKIMLDFVPNHTSSQHSWFIESSSSLDNPKRNWYLWADGTGENPPNNWLSVFGGSGWEFDARTKQYYFHSFLKEQPDLNWRNPEVRKAMNDVLRFWLKRGVDGFRMDAVYHMVKDDQLRDNPANPDFILGSGDPYHAQLNVHTHGLAETLVVLKEFSGTLAEFGDTFMVTEVHIPFEQLIQMYPAIDPQRHSPFNFNFIHMPWSAIEYKKFVDAFEKKLLPQYLPNYVLGNHDKSRVATRVGQQRARLLAMLQFTLRGMPFIYYGEELGMEDSVIPSELIQDPFEKNVPGMKLGRDPERTPMQWDSSEYAGFSTYAPWLPINENYLQINAATESVDPASMLALYKDLIRLRQSSPALMEGAYSSFVLNDNIFSYSRKFGLEEFVVLLNFAAVNQMVTVPQSETICVLSTYMDNRDRENLGFPEISLRPYEGILLKINNKS